MDKDLIKGVKQGIGIVLVLSCVLLVSAVGFHTANEILGGTFIGNYSFNGKLNISNPNYVLIFRESDSGDQRLKFYNDRSASVFNTAGFELGVNSDSTVRTSLFIRAGLNNISDINRNSEVKIGTQVNGTYKDIIVIDGEDIGIGTMSPIAKLSVAGNITAESICDETGANCQDLSLGSSSSGLVNKQFYSIPGTYVFNVPSGVNKLHIQAWGAGGGGGDSSIGSGGTDTFVNYSGTVYTAGAGSGGGGCAPTVTWGVGGIVSGSVDFGSSGSRGSAGIAGSSSVCLGGDGGDSPFGGSGGTGGVINSRAGSTGTFPGGGGGGAQSSGNYGQSGGGGGAYFFKILTVNPSDTIEIIVGAGGIGDGNGGDGADGAVIIEWT